MLLPGLYIAVQHVSTFQAEIRAWRRARGRRRHERGRGGAALKGWGRRMGMHDDRAFSRGLSFFLYAAVVLLVVGRRRARGGVFLLLELAPGRSARWAGIGVKCMLVMQI